MITQNYKLNIIPKIEKSVRGITPPPTVNVSQYDKGLRTLVFDLYDGANGRLTIQEGQTAKIYGKKPDANVFEYDMTIGEDMRSVSIVLQEQMAVVAGCVKCEVRIFDGTSTVGSANFILAVEKAPVGAEEAYSESELPEIDNLLYGGEVGQVFTKTRTGARWALIGTDSGLMMKSEYDPNDTGSVLEADHADDADTVDGHTVARDVLANEYTNEDIDSMMQAAGTVKTVNSIQPDQNGNVQIAKADIGLGNVDNTSDANKPISTATQAALDRKVDKVTGKGLSTNDYTDADKTKLGDLPTDAELTAELAGKVDKESGKGLSTNDFTDAEKTKLQGIEAGAQVNAITGVKGSAEPSYRSGNVSISKTDIGLGNVDDTSDLDKPVSTAMQTALDQKQNKLTFDTEPTENSGNPVTSGGIFLSQKAQDNKTDALADLLNAKYADDWATIQTMIQIGYGKKYYPVGTQFTIHHDVYGDMLFDVIGHDHDLPAGKDHSMTLLMHNVIYSTQFDEVEGFYYCENGLTAGTYNVTITRQPWFAGDVGKTFQFTLASDVPAGAILWWDGYNVSREGRTVRVFDTQGATSAAQTATMTEGNGGTALGSVDGTGNFNIFDRTVLGSNDWEESGVRQWLNADVASGWWEPKTNWDRLVSYHSRPGFLYGFDPDFKAVLAETTHGNRSNTVFDSHGTNRAYSTTEKFFLLCNEEVNLEQEQSIVCGTVYDFYKDAANADRIKYDITSTGTARYWWLRSPYPWYAYGERTVNTSGALIYDLAYGGHGVAAACVIA